MLQNGGNITKNDMLCSHDNNISIRFATKPPYEMANTVTKNNLPPAWVIACLIVCMGPFFCFAGNKDPVKHD